MRPTAARSKATIHWVSAAHAVDAEVRLYDRLFTVADPDEHRRRTRPISTYLNPASLEVLRECQVEPASRPRQPARRFQFERLGYFCVDPDSRPGALVFNRTVTLRDTWARIDQRQKAHAGS